MRMNISSRKYIDSLSRYAIVWIAFFLGLWLVIARSLEPYFALIPGDLGDARFNNYSRQGQKIPHFLNLNKDYWSMRDFQETA